MDRGGSEWDEAKCVTNLAMHGLSFTAVYEFVWDTAFTRTDTRSKYGEERYVSIGFIESRLHVLVWTPRGGKLRIISLRKANSREKKRSEHNA